VRSTAGGVPWRSILSATGAVALGHLVYSWVVRPWHLEWGATPAELQTAMPGDELVPHPTICATRALTIDAPPDAVWPWIVQMGGYTRAGWYSYDRFDNAGRPSADRIVPELQRLEVGDILYTSRAEGFVVREIHPRHALVLSLDRNGSRITSVPMITPLPGGRTRLVQRLRAHFRPRHRLFALFFDVGDFVFMRKQMRGIKTRAETQPARPVVETGSAK
jgi:hypothetical protein